MTNACSSIHWSQAQTHKETIMFCGTLKLRLKHSHFISVFFFVFTFLIIDLIYAWSYAYVDVSCCTLDLFSLCFLCLLFALILRPSYDVCFDLYGFYACINGSRSHKLSNGTSVSHYIGSHLIDIMEDMLTLSQPTRLANISVSSEG